MDEKNFHFRATPPGFFLTNNFDIYYFTWTMNFLVSLFSIQPYFTMQIQSLLNSMRVATKESTRSYDNIGFVVLYFVVLDSQFSYLKVI